MKWLFNWKTLSVVVLGILAIFYLPEIKAHAQNGWTWFQTTKFYKTLNNKFGSTTNP
jgi:hypothetical protein